MLSFLEELSGAGLEGCDGSPLILLGSALFLFKLEESSLINQGFILDCQLFPELSKLCFVAEDQGFLVGVLVDDRSVLDGFGTIREFQSRELVKVFKNYLFTGKFWASKIENNSKN